MDAQWESKFLASIPRVDVAQEQEFLALVDQAEGRCSLDVARVLLKSFQEKDDYGTQERVVSVLASANERDRIVAVLEELPRLVSEAPEWASILVGQEIDRRPELLTSVALQVATVSKVALLELLSRPEVQEMFPGAIEILPRVA